MEKRLVDYLLELQNPEPSFTSRISGSSTRAVAKYSTSVMDDIKMHPDKSFSFTSLPASTQTKQSKLFQLYQVLNKTEERLVYPSGDNTRAIKRKELLAMYIDLFSDHFFPHHLLPYHSSGVASIAFHSVAITDFITKSDEEKDDLTSYLMNEMKSSSNFSSLNNSVKVDGKLRKARIMPMESAFHERIIDASGLWTFFVKLPFPEEIQSHLVRVDMPNANKFVTKRNICLELNKDLYLTMVVAVKPRTSPLLFHDIAVSMHLQTIVRTSNCDLARLSDLQEALLHTTSKTNKERITNDINKCELKNIHLKEWNDISSTLIWTYAAFYCGTTMNNAIMCQTPSYITTYALKESVCCNTWHTLSYHLSFKDKIPIHLILLACLQYLINVRTVSRVFVHGDFTCNSICLRNGYILSGNYDLKVFNFCFTIFNDLKPLPFTMNDKTSSLEQTSCSFFTTFLSYNKEPENYTILTKWYDLFSLLTSIHEIYED